jgi:hypothetical protein
LLPWLLREIPMAALGAVLVVTGARLVNFSMSAICSRDYGVLPAADLGGDLRGRGGPTC